jgi:hypothetical protein
MKRLYISMPPDLTMMVEEALALIERPPPPPEEREMNELIRRTSTSTWLAWREAVDRVARYLGSAAGAWETGRAGGAGVVAGS